MTGAANGSGLASRRHLCQQLRQARTDAGLTQRDAIDILGWSLSKLARVEAGKVGLISTDLRSLLDLYGIDDLDTRADLENLARRTRRDAWTSYSDVLSTADRRYLADEGAASHLRQFAPLLIPDLLRTENYARIVTEALAPPGLTPQLLDRTVEACLARQNAILDRDPPTRLHFIIDEYALARIAGQHDGDTSIIREQAQRLFDLACRPAITIQLLPFGVGVHAGLATGPFILLEFDDPDDPGLLHLPTGGKPTITDTDTVTRYDQTFTHLVTTAPPPHAIHTELDRILNSGNHKMTP